MKPPTRPVRSWIRRAGLGAVGLWVSWFGGVNLVLALHLIPRLINEHNPIVELDYASAWTLWPGTVHLRGFTLRGRDREHLEFSFDLDQADVVVDLLALRHRTFRATHVEVEGLDARIRASFDPQELTLAQTKQSQLPPIAGYADPPMKQLGPLALAVDDAHDRYWTVELPEVSILSLRQLWVQQFRFRMHDGQVTGHFSIHPERAFELSLLPLAFDQASLTIGDSSVLQDLHGVLTCEVERFDPRALEGHDFLHFISSQIEADGSVVGLDFLHALLPELSIEGGGGPLQASVTIDHGILADGTHLALQGTALHLESERLQLHGGLSLDAKVGVKSGQTRGEVEVNLMPVTLSLRADHRARIAGRALRLHASSEELDLVAPFDKGQLEIDGDHLVTPLPAWLEQATRALTIESGEATTEIHLSMELPSLRGKGHLKVRSDRVTTRLKGQEMSATTEATLTLDHFDLRAETLDLSGSELSLRADTAPSFDHEIEGWWLKAQVAHAVATFHPHATFDTALHIQARDARPILDFLSEVGSLPHVVSQALNLPNLEGRAQAHFEEGRLSLSPLRVTSGESMVLGTTSLGETVTATLLVRSGPLAVGLGLANHELNVSFLHGQADLDRALLLAAAPR